MFDKILNMGADAFRASASWLNAFEHPLSFGAGLIGAFMMILLVHRLLIPFIGNGMSDMVKKTKSKKSKDE